MYIGRFDIYISQVMFMASIAYLPVFHLLMFSRLSSGISVCREPSGLVSFWIKAATSGDAL
jgi:hypothetical protein